MLSNVLGKRFDVARSTDESQSMGSNQPVVGCVLPFEATF
jgi:hypothetical protein